jgi:hypothetical protein
MHSLPFSTVDLMVFVTEAGMRAPVDFTQALIAFVLMVVHWSHNVPLFPCSHCMISPHMSGIIIDGHIILIKLARIMIRVSYKFIFLVNFSNVLDSMCKILCC